MYQIKLTPYAKTFYTEWLLEPTSVCYNLATDQVLYGKLDIAKLQKAIKRYIHEHVLLNSHIQEFHGEPYWIKNNSIYELEYSEYPEKKSELLQYIAKPFDLHKGPLYRFKLLRIEKETYRFIIVLHHIIIDGMSTNTGLFEAIPNYYNNENYVEPYSISEQIKLLENLENLISNKLELNKIKYREFWRKQLSGEIRFNIEAEVVEKLIG